MLDVAGPDYKPFHADKLCAWAPLSQHPPKPTTPLRANGAQCLLSTDFVKNTNNPQREGALIGASIEGLTE